MSSSPSTHRVLSTAEERRESILQAAERVYAARGFHGTPTLAVAKEAGISQAYLFRLFPTKADLSMALVERCNQRVYDTFANAAAEARAEGADVMSAMGQAYRHLIADRTLLLLQMHSFTAAVDSPEIRDAARAGFRRLYELVRRETGASPERLRQFFATGMLLNVLGALDAFELDEEWVHACSGPRPDIDDAS